MHDWTLFQLAQVGKYCIKRKFLYYKLIENCAYLIWLWIYSPFKGSVEDLKSYKTNWNFTQSFTCMCIECVFGILNGR